MKFRWVASIVCAMLIMGLMPAQCTEVLIKIDQVGAMKEPFNVGKSVFYTIIISNASHPMSYDLEMNIGPDIDDPSNKKTYSVPFEMRTKRVNDPIIFEVNFQDPDLRKGEFSKWLIEKNQTGAWEKAWYNLEFKMRHGGSFATGSPFYVEPKRDYTGRPALIKPFEEFEADVTPREGTNENNFTYRLDVLSSEADKIKLEIASARDGPWTDLGSQDYATPGSHQILIWPNKTLGFDFSVGYYRFTGKKQSDIFEGPFWPVQVNFDNATVKPPSGTPDKKFTYTLDLNASRSIEVVLNVLDVGTGKYFSAGRQSYANSSQWQRINWNNIGVTSQEEAIGQSSYYFSFHYPGSERYLNTTKNIKGSSYLGPNLSIVNIISNVAPLNGTVYTPFTYTARIDTSKPMSNIELEILPPGSRIFAPQGPQKYDRNDGILIWPNISFKAYPDALGMARYRFVVDGKSMPDEYPGPEIDVAVRKESAKPITGTDKFDYSAEVRSTRPQLEMELLYTDDGVTWERSGILKSYNRTLALASNPEGWMALTWNNQKWHSMIRVDEEGKR